MRNYLTATSADCTNFYSHLAIEHPNMHGWDDANEGVISIPENLIDANPKEFSILTKYGQLTMEMIEDYETTYINTEGRQAQTTHMLYQCLMWSMSKEGKKKILIWNDEYHIDGNKSGTLLLKVIIRESHIDTNATTSNIRTKLSSLDTYIHTIGQDIAKTLPSLMVMSSYSLALFKQEERQRKTY
jgi:hypothetical protein